jgi:NAD(P)-dependent dehydrogenase (short-subunit alcohol dehydrogenase family)
MYDMVRARMTPEQLAAHEEHMRSHVPLGGKLGDPDTDMAPVLVFMVSDASRYISGQTICVDGAAVLTR